MAKISDYLYQKASVNRIPLSGTFELSPVCNFSCKMCYVRKTAAQIEHEGKRLKTWNEWLKLAEQCRAEGMLYLLLTGGEPFIYPNFKELYLKLHAMGFLISINTNGTLINEETIEWIKTAPPTRINITLYGASSETYGRVCRNESGFESAKRAILLLKQAGITVVVNGSIIPQNERELEQLLLFGKENGIFTRVSTYMFPPVRREHETTDSRCSAEESAKLFLRKQRCSLGEDQYLHFLKDEIKKIDRTNEEISEDLGSRVEYMRCRAGRSTFWVSWEGTMTACGMMPFPIQVYPFEDSFGECWKRLTDSVRTTPVLKGCEGCLKKEICNPCAAMVYAETGEVNCKAPYLCKMTEYIIYEIEDELKEGKSNE